MGLRPERRAGGKFLRLVETCEELAERQEKGLVFTQFREIIGPLAERPMAIFGRPGLVLHGATGVGKRQRLVTRFQSDGPESCQLRPIAWPVLEK